MSKPLIVVLLLICSQFTHAGIISYNGYTLNEATNIVTNDATGLEWLQWDVLDGVPLADAVSSVANSYDGGGWRLASNDEMAALLNAFNFGANASFVTSDSVTSFSSSETAFQRIYYTPGDVNDFFADPIIQIVELFGPTNINSSLTAYYNSLGITGSFARVLFGSDLNGNGLINAADFSLGTVCSTTCRLDDGQVRWINETSSQFFSNGSTALVRVSKVSEPSSILLLLVLLTLFVRNASKVKRRS